MNLGQYHHKLKGADFPLWKPIYKVWPKVVESGFEGEKPLKDHALQEIPFLNQEWMLHDASDDGRRISVGFRSCSVADLEMTQLPASSTPLKNVQAKEKQFWLAGWQYPPADSVVLRQIMENHIHQISSRESCTFMQTDNAAMFQPKIM
ncbi:hypothetical protein NC653_028977 [Populus alba x Populus x berolinensis]|uniref:Uncharacterized protein n=1 Tax=Populus alba x Populus x berolinensis TaxID=444605 RepID=A0AAD6Q4Q3_9ROSI|nr:hypothetical protein NC653_028977 [Populus alba x Populus x berolinensis]